MEGNCGAPVTCKGIEQNCIEIALAISFLIIRRNLKMTQTHKNVMQHSFNTAVEVVHTFLALAVLLFTTLNRFYTSYPFGNKACKGCLGNKDHIKEWKLESRFFYITAIMFAGL